MNPKDSLTIHGRANPAPDTDVVYCLNCEDDAVCFYDNDRGGESFLCQRCADAFELGQTYPYTTVRRIEEMNEPADEDAE